MAAVNVTTLTSGDVIRSGLFAHAHAGRLQVNFQGAWRINGGDYDSAGDIVLRCFVGSGPGRLTALLNAATATAQIDITYPGGLVAVPLGWEYVAHEVAGPVLMNWTKLLATYRLLGAG